MCGFGSTRKSGRPEIPTGSNPNQPIDTKAVEITLYFKRWMELIHSRPTGEALLKSMEAEIERWERILKNRIKAAAPTILGRAFLVYPLPKGSRAFVESAWRRWQ